MLTIKTTGERFAFTLKETNGALGDIGTLLPLMLGAIVIGGLAPMPVLLGFAVFYITTAVYYRLPIPVQPMKAVAAALLVTGMTPETVAASGVLIGITLLILGWTGWINRLARLVPQSVLAGLQLGLGVALALMSLALMASSPLIAVVTLVLVLALLKSPRFPAVLIGLAVAMVLAQWLNVPTLSLGSFTANAGLIAVPALPSLAELEQAVSTFVLPQLSLTLTNAILLTALVAGDYFGDKATHVTPARLSLSSGLANLALSPLGAFPMCHGAGGLAAHHRFGARSGAAPLILGLGLIAFALLPGGLGITLLAAIPAAGLGALLLIAAWQLAVTRRLFDGKPSCWPVIAVTAAVTVVIDPFWGLVMGGCSEVVRKSIVSRLPHYRDT